MVQKLGIGWQVGGTTGWGVYGSSLLLRSAQHGLTPIPLHVSEKFSPNPFEERQLAHLPRQWALEQQLFELGEGSVDTGYPFLMGLGNDFGLPAQVDAIKGTPDIGVIFFESRDFDPQEVRDAQQRFHKMIAGSSWNAEVLEDAGFHDVAFCPQGVDVTRFHPAPRNNIFGDRFVIFSGGKLEFRKGQDIVVEAFRRFYVKHPDAMLVVAWHNHWDASVESIGLSPYGLGVPKRDAQSGQWCFSEWLQGVGVPADAVIDLGEVAHQHLPQLLRECDVGVFPNRSEGGTNLVAMECMACGIPSIVSDNTGHRDLLPDDAVALRLGHQTSLSGRSPMFADWGESDPDEIVAHLEVLYADHQKRQVIGAAGSEFMAGWSWPNQIDVLLRELDLIS